MKHRILTVAAGLALVLLSLSACASKKMPDSKLIDQISTATWELELLNGDPVVSEEPVTMQFDLRESTLSGNAPCNLYSGELDTSRVREGFIGISNIIATRRACPQLTSEKEFFEALEQVKVFRAKDGKLLLLASPESTEALIQLKPRR